MKTICEPINVNDKLLSGFVSVFHLMDMIEQNTENEFILDFSKAQFVSPTFTLPLLTFLKGCNKNYRFQNVSGYLSTIHFADAIKPDEGRISAFKAMMEAYGNKSFMPIINFPTKASSDDVKNQILSTVENLLIHQANISGNVAAGLKYIVEECVDNITQHSKSERGAIVAQAYPNKHYLDICIADNGVTLLGSYLENNDQDIASDLEAMQAANRGISTKNLPDAENRGYGIITSKKMLVEGLDGAFVMLSGTAMYLYNRVENRFIELPHGLRCPGTIVAFRVPYINGNFNYINYVE